VAELVGSIETRACSIFLVGAEDYDGVVLEWQGEGVDVAGVEGQPGDDDAVLLHQRYDIVDIVARRSRPAAGEP
jgi:hypothetical protein